MVALCCFADVLLAGGVVVDALSTAQVRSQKEARCGDGKWFVNL